MTDFCLSIELHNLRNWLDFRISCVSQHTKSQVTQFWSDLIILAIWRAEQWATDDVLRCCSTTHWSFVKPDTNQWRDYYQTWKSIWDYLCALCAVHNAWHTESTVSSLSLWLSLKWSKFVQTQANIYFSISLSHSLESLAFFSSVSFSACPHLRLIHSLRSISRLTTLAIYSEWKKETQCKTFVVHVSLLPASLIINPVRTHTLESNSSKYIIIIIWFLCLLYIMCWFCWWLQWLPPFRSWSQMW